MFFQRNGIFTPYYYNDYYYHRRHSSEEVILLYKKVYTTYRAFLHREGFFINK